MLKPSRLLRVKQSEVVWKAAAHVPEGKKQFSRLYAYLLPTRSQQQIMKTVNWPSRCLYSDVPPERSDSWCCTWLQEDEPVVMNEP